METYTLTASRSARKTPCSTPRSSNTEIRSIKGEFSSKMRAERFRNFARCRFSVFSRLRNSGCAR